MGSLAYENWKAAISGVEVASAFEYPLYSDCAIRGEIISGLGPYELFNAVTDEQSGTNAVRAFLRVTIHRSRFVKDFVDPGSEHDHGGLIEDEIAALLSLCLGARLKAGATTRVFQADRDPRGLPYVSAFPGETNPVLAMSRRAPVVPNVLQAKNFEDVNLLFCFPKLSPEHSIAVARAARLYQDALWIVDSEPELSWLMLVSAVETAAVSRDDQRSDHAVALRTVPYGKKLYKFLESEGQEKLFPEVAKILSRFTRAKGKFTDFLMEFRPPPPELRPEENRRISWDPDDLRTAFDTIYDHRSNALHGGIPFPGPMSWPPTLRGDGFDERLIGGRAGSRGAMWDTEMMPMLLGTFEYIVRGALQTWWRSNAAADEAAKSSDLVEE